MNFNQVLKTENSLSLSYLVKNGIGSGGEPHSSAKGTKPMATITKIKAVLL